MNIFLLNTWLAAGLLASSVTVAAAPRLTHHEQHAQRYLIQFAQPLAENYQASNAAITETLQPLGIHPLRYLANVNAVVATLTPDRVKALQSHPDITTLEPDPVRYLQDDQTTWGITQVQAPLVSDSATGNRKICIIDTGYALGHEDLMSGEHVTGESIDSTNGQDQLGVWSEDSYGHGTHIAGIIASVDNNYGLVGVNPGNRINLHNVKIINNPHYWSIWGSDLIAAVDACTQAGAHVINMSIAGQDASALEAQAMQQAADQGALLLAASGNRGSDSYYYPASYDAVVSVGAIDSNQHAWRYTQSNDQVELVAPGVGIKSTIPGDLYGKKDGTSMATAFASGVAGLVWSHFPQCSATQIRQVLTASAQDLGEAGQDDTFGFGLIQAKASLTLLEQGGCHAGADTFPSCNAILEAGGSTGDGMYTIDVDGDGPVAPTEVYCDMTRQGGGWTLYARHKDGIATVQSVNPVTPSNWGVMNDSVWVHLRDSMSVGMMFRDEFNRVSLLSKSKLTSAGCLSIQQVNSLNNIPGWTIWHHENSGCSLSGLDYSNIFLSGDTYHYYKTSGAALYNWASSKFEIWPYNTADSYTQQDTLLYFIK